MIKINNVTVSFDKKIVLDKINADFTIGKLYGIVGFNGAGKTTFFNTLSCGIKPDSGNITINGEKISNKIAGYLETNNFFYSGITGNEYLKIFNQSNSNFNLSVLQEYMKLPLDNLIETYSSGMKKKLALLAVLKQDKSVYLFDEPFNGLDLETNKVLEIIILALRDKGKTIFISSHIVDPLFHVCDEIMFLENGRFIKSFHKNEFNTMEEALFGKLKEEARVVISKSI